jgi:hypothetical protein
MLISVFIYGLYSDGPRSKIVQALRCKMEVAVSIPGKVAFFN